MLPIIISWWKLHRAKAELVQILFRWPNNEGWVDSSLVVLFDPGIKPWRFSRMEGLYILKITPYKYLCQLFCLAWVVDSSYLFLCFSFTFRPNKCSLVFSPLLTRIISRKGHQIKSSFCVCLGCTFSSIWHSHP